MLYSLLIEPKQATWFLEAKGFLDALTQQHQQPKSLPNRRFEDAKLKHFNSQHCQGDTIRWTDPLRNCEENGGHLLTPACVFFSSTGDQNELDWWKNVPSIGRWAEHWTRANVCPFSMAKFVQCISMFCSFWLGTGTGNVIPSSERISGGLNTAASATKESSSHKVWGVWKTPAFSDRNIAEKTLFIDLTFAKIETVKRMVLSQLPLVHTCICALCESGNWKDCRFSRSGRCLTPASALSVRYRWLIWTGLPHKCPINWWATPARHWTKASACSFSMAKFVQCSTHSWSNQNRQRDF